MVIKVKTIIQYFFNKSIFLHIFKSHNLTGVEIIIQIAMATIKNILKIKKLDIVILIADPIIVLYYYLILKCKT